MPVNKDALTRYRIIDNYLSNKLRRPPTLEQLADACGDVLGRAVSTSTIEKDIRAMKEDPPRGYAAPIVYDKEKRGYVYAEMGFSISGLKLEPEEWEGLAYAANLLHQYREVPLFRSFKEAIDKIHARFTIPYDLNDPEFEAFVQFETGHSTSGYQWLGCCYSAIRERLRLKLLYNNIYRQETKSYLIQPCLLKEHRNCWYVIGWVEERNNYLTFALDRIQEATTVPGRQKPRTDFDIRHFFQHAVGIMEGDGSAVVVELELFSPADKLVLLEPLHPTQHTIKQGKKSTTIQLMVNINPELCQRILALGPSCKIKKPAVLRQAVKEQLEQTLQHYR